MGNQSSVINLPTKVDSLKGVNIVRVFCGATYSMFLSDQEELYACGMNDLGQLGIDTSQQELQKMKMNLTA